MTWANNQVAELTEVGRGDDGEELVARLAVGVDLVEQIGERLDHGGAFLGFAEHRNLPRRRGRSLLRDEAVEDVHGRPVPGEAVSRSAMISSLRRGESARAPALDPQHVELAPHGSACWIARWNRSTGKFRSSSCTSRSPGVRR